MSYRIGRWLENTANSSFLRISGEGVDISKLIAAPVMTERDANYNGAPALNIFDGFVNSSDRDYAINEERETAQTAIQPVRRQLGKTYLPIITGQAVQTDNYVESVNLANSSQVAGKTGLANVSYTLFTLSTNKEG